MVQVFDLMFSGLVMVPITMVLSALSLISFTTWYKALFQMVKNLPTAYPDNAVMDYALTVLKSLTVQLKSTLGDPNNWRLGLKDVILVAILVAILSQGSRSLARK